MSIPGAASPLFLATTAGGAAGDFSIARSLRFNAPDSSYLNRTPSSGSNRKTWTWSGWIKKSGQSSNQFFFGAGEDDGGNTNQIQFFFMPNDKFRITTAQVVFRETTQVFRDPSSFLHLVVAFDTTQSTANDRIKIYVNGSQVTNFSITGNPAQNADTGVNSAADHRIGQGSGASYSGSSYAFNGYLAECILVDGSALDPTSFGQADSDGVWRPIDTAGLSFGTNGFRLKFADNSSNAALGTDSSGNSNTWTVNNLSVGTVSNLTAKQNFDVVTYSGTSSTQSISSLSFKPDFIWFKARSYAGSHALVDSVRGISKQLSSNLTNAESTNSAGAGPQSFNSNGFTLGNESSATGSTNGSQTYVAWCWKAGGAASSNTDGSGLTNVQVSANTSYGFSIVTYTGGGSGSANSDSGDSFGHGLSSAPKFVICKRRNSANGWPVYHASTALGALSLNSNVALDTASYLFAKKHPSSSVVYLGNNPEINATGSTYVAYCWSEVAGFSKFGTYTGVLNGVSVTTGFKPKFVIIKRVGNGSDGNTTNGGWGMYQEGVTDQQLMANCSGEEGVKGDCQTGSAKRDIQAGVAFDDNGFTVTAGWYEINDPTAVYIYAAFAATVDESAINDCFVDTPSNAAEPTDTGVGNEVVGNYATLNPLDNNGLTLSNGNLDASRATNSWATCKATFGLSSDKWYFEYTVNSGASNQIIGVFKTEDTPPAVGGYGYMTYSASGWGYQLDGNKANSNSFTATGTTAGVGDNIMVAVDVGAGKIWFGVNGTWLNSGDPANGNNAAFTNLSGSMSPAVCLYGTQSGSINFGSRAFSYTAPTNFKSLNTANLPTPTIADGSQYFDTKLYTGNGGTQVISGLSFNSDLIWTKQRSTVSPLLVTGHSLQDTVRGTDGTYYKELSSNTTNAENVLNNGLYGGLSSISSTGFTVVAGTDTSYQTFNGNNCTYVAWNWDGGTSTVTNNDGSIASQVRAQPSAGFSVVTYTVGNNTAQTIGHGLNAAPHLIIVKERNQSNNWQVYHSSLGNGNYLMLNSTNASASNNLWDNTSPTNSVFSIRSGGSANFYDGKNHVAYCFAPVNSYSAMGSYIGTGGSVFVYLGFRPRFILIKNVTQANTWFLVDSARSPYNQVDKILLADTSASETTYGWIDFLSNGFKINNTGTGNNNSGRETLYYAVAENPFQANGGLAR